MRAHDTGRIPVETSARANFADGLRRLRRRWTTESRTQKLREVLEGIGVPHEFDSWSRTRDIPEVRTLDEVSVSGPRVEVCKSRLERLLVVRSKE